MERYYFTIYNSTSPDGLFESVVAESLDDAKKIIHELYWDASLILPLKN